MKILIHSLETGLYLGEENRWVQDIAGARDFLQSSAAVNHVLDQGLDNVELIYSFASREYNMSIPLRSLKDSARQPSP